MRLKECYIIIIWLLTLSITLTHDTQVEGDTSITEETELYYSFDGSELIEMNNLNQILINCKDDDGDDVIDDGGPVINLIGQTEDNYILNNNQDDDGDNYPDDGNGINPQHGSVSDNKVLKDAYTQTYIDRNQNGIDEDNDHQPDDGRTSILIENNYKEGLTFQWDKEDESFLPETSDNDAIMIHGPVQTGNTPFGKAMYFEGDEEYILGNIKNPHGSAFTLEAWVYPEDPGEGTNVICGYNYYDYYFARISIINTGNPNLGFLKIEFKSGAIVFQSTKTIPYYHWSYIAVSIELDDGGKMAVCWMIINGEFEYNYQIREDYWYCNWYTPNFYIGTYKPNENDEYFHGYIDEFKLHYNFISAPVVSYALEGVGGIVGDWPIKDGAGDIFLDRGSNKLHGIIYGSTINWIADGCHGGSNKRSLLFNGIDNYGYITDPNCYMRPWTFEIWIKPDISAGNNIIPILTMAQSPSSVNGLYIIKNSRYLQIDYGNSYTFTGEKITFDEWNYIQIVNDGSYSQNSLKVYINGILSGSMNGGGDDNDFFDSSLILGKHAINPIYYKGLMTEMIIFQYAKTIDQLHHYSFTSDSNTYYDVNIDYDNSYLPLKKNGISYSSEGMYGLGSLIFEGDETSSEYCVITESIPYIFDYRAFKTINGLTIDCWINIDAYNDASGNPSIIINKWGKYNTCIYPPQYSDCGEYRLLIDDYDSNGNGKIGFQIGCYPNSDTIWTNSLGNFKNEWHHITASYINGEPGIVQIFFDGIMIKQSLSNINSLTNHYYEGVNNIYIGSYIDPIAGTISNRLNGKISEIRISEYNRNLHEDFDHDMMPDQYEIIRSIYSDIYNPNIHNGRYALLVAPVRTNEDVPYKYNIFIMRNYLKTLNWNDDDIISLTVETSSDNDGRPDLTRGDSFNYAGSWIDGEAFKDNLYSTSYSTVYSVLSNGGSFSLQKHQNNGEWVENHFYKIKNDDIFIEYLSGHSGDGSIPNFNTYQYNNYDQVAANQWSAPSNRERILYPPNYKYGTLILDMCYSGWWLSSQQSIGNGDSSLSTNRAILTAGTNSLSWTCNFIVGDYFEGTHRANWLTSGGSITPVSLCETLNADGVESYYTPLSNTYPIDRKLTRFILDDIRYNQIISFQEGSFFTNVVCCQDVNPLHFQDPDYWEGTEIPIQLYF